MSQAAQADGWAAFDQPHWVPFEWQPSQAQAPAWRREQQRVGLALRPTVHPPQPCDPLPERRERGLCPRAGRGDLECHRGTGNGVTVMEIIQAAREITGHEIPAEVVARLGVESDERDR